MTYKTKKRTGEVRFMQNNKPTDSQILQRQKRLRSNLEHFFKVGLIPASWVAEIARMEGLVNV